MRPREQPHHETTFTDRICSLHFCARSNSVRVGNADCPPECTSGLIAAQPSKSMAGAITVAVMAGVIAVAEVITMDGVEATTMDKAIITISENVIW
jgi:hypothetical protein